MKKKSTSQSAFFNLRVLIAALFCLGGVAVALLGTGAFSSAFAQSKDTRSNSSTTRRDPAGTQLPDVATMLGPVRVNQDLRSLPSISPKERETERPLTRYPHGTGHTRALPGHINSGLDYVQGLLKSLWRPSPTMPSPLLTFEGGDEAQFSGFPPDSDGDVGPHHYVEALNTAFKVFDKNGNTLAGPTAFDSLFAPLTGTPCGSSQNHGDPFVLYDPLADRWLISDFAFPSFPGTSFWQCIAVSQTNNPVSGGWFLYALQVDPSNPTFHGDYPKFAMWNSGGLPAQNAYFVTMNEFSSPTTFNGVRVYALDRASMLSGGPVNSIGFSIPIAGLGDAYSLVAANFRNGNPPPTGVNEFLLAVDSPPTGGQTLSQVKGWLFLVDFGTPSNSTLGIGANHSPNAIITVNPFVDATTDANGFAIVPQQGTTQLIDTIGDKIMTPVVYQNRSGTESLWADQTVIENYPNGPTVVRWYQFDVTGGNFPTTAAQQQDWSNGNDGVWRFMPSIAVDANGNMAIGYSTSSSTLFPGIRYAGRLVTDPPGNLSQGEATMFNGTGSQMGSDRWGDYSMTTVDPADGMTFWHVNEYYATTSSFNWHTRIGKFNFVHGGPRPTPTPTYATFDIPDARGIFANGINPAGAITGWYSVGSFPNILNHSFVRARDGTLTTFDDPDAGTGPFQGTSVGSSGAAGPPINPGGVITGHYVDASGMLHGFLRAPEGTFTTVDAPGAINGTGFLCCITPAGAVAGNFFDANFVGHGFVRAPGGTFTTFDAPGGVNGTGPSGITPAGVITGWYADANFVLHGFVRAPDGTITTFDAPGAVNGTTPSGINSAGVITGTFFDTDFVGHGFLRTQDGTFTTFDAPGAVFFGTGPVGINPAQAITGSYSDAFTFHGFLRVPDGTITNFDPPNSVSTFPTVINAAGVITGTYFDASGADHGFLRIP